MSDLFYNKQNSTSKLLFSIRSKTQDIKKTYNPWKYKNNLSVMCMKENETIKHLIRCEGYEDTISIDWENNLSGNLVEQSIIQKYVEKIQKIQNIFVQQETGQASEPGSTAVVQGYCKALWNK